MVSADTTTFFAATGHLANLIISDRTDIQDECYGVDDAQVREIKKCFAIAQQGTAAAGTHLRNMIDRYPRNPVFFNYLGTWHQVRNEPEMAKDVLFRAMERAPRLPLRQRFHGALMPERGPTR